MYKINLVHNYVMGWVKKLCREALNVVRKYDEI